MALSPGARVGPYEIAAAIGAGGMGEVYRGRDTRLNRDVAIKVLPDLFACDPERLARFEREAQLLAALNHPHIAHIYGVEEAGRTRAIVMEFVDGEDLAQRIARGALPVDDALQIARQIADALESAHERGVIHRDLKPANVKVDDDGRVKVLDFGLAKALDPTVSNPTQLMNSPTLTSPATMVGTIIGTAAYMAPEQAKGKGADKRADIWAFGVVLYEMLTGGRLFDGETIIETMGLIATRDVDLSRLPSTTPARIRELLRRCLERDPKQRLRDIGEARIAIDRASIDPVDGVARARPALPPRTSLVRRTGFVAVALALAAAAGGVTWWWTSQRRPQLPLRRFVLAVTTGGTGGAGSRDFVVSPDGRSVAYVTTDRRLAVWELDRLRPRELKGPGETGSGEMAPAPIWSPDSAFIAYASRGRLWRISATDGDPVAICNAPGAVGGGAWHPDGTIVFATTRGPMYQVAAAGGEPKVLIPLAEGEVDFHQPTALPGGRAILYAVHGRSGTDTIEAFSHGTRKVVLRLPEKVRASPQVFNHPAYSPTGHMLYRLEEGNVGVWAVPFSLAKLETTGEPFLVASGARNPSVAEDGTFVYAPTADAAPGQIVWLRNDGSIEQVLGEARQGLEYPDLSSDGRIAYTAWENNNSDVWILDAAGGATRITATPINESRAQWSPDGRTVMFDCPTDQGAAVCAKSADGSGETRVLLRNGVDLRLAPDGKTGVYETNGTAERGLKIYDVETGQSRPYVLGTFELNPMGFSANGKYFAYASFRSGTARIYVRQYPSGDGEWEVPGLRSERISWPQGGRDLFAIVGSGRETPVAAVSIDTAGPPVFGKPRVLFTLSANRLALLDGFVAAPGGKRFLAVQRQRSDADVTGIVVVQNWLAEFGGR